MRRLLSTLAFSLMITTASLAFAQTGAPSQGGGSPSAGGASAAPGPGAAPGGSAAAQDEDTTRAQGGTGSAGQTPPSAPNQTGTMGSTPPPPPPAATGTRSGAAGPDTTGRQGAAKPGAAGTQSGESWRQRYQAQLRNVAPELRPGVERRMGPDQRPIEIAQTMMLNRFGAMGFAKLQDLEKSGNRYIASVQTRRGDSENLVIDPATAEIRKQGQGPMQRPGQRPEQAPAQRSMSGPQQGPGPGPRS